MFDVSSYKIGIFLFSFFHYHLVECETFWIRQFNIKMLCVNIYSVIMKEPMMLSMISSGR